MKYPYSKMASAFKHVCKYFAELENSLFRNILQKFSQGYFAPALINLPPFQNADHSSSIKDLLKNTILWAVPKKRRSIQKIRNRRFGFPDKHWKMIVPKTNILICRECGGYKESGKLCGICYNKVMAETKEIQKKISSSLGLSPVEQEVVVLYEGDEKHTNPELWEGKRIVEMQKPRPKFFSNNLLQGTTQPNATSADLQIVPEVKE